MQEQAQENLERIYADHMRILEGMNVLAQLLEECLPKRELTLLLLDLDGSQRVRQHGIEAKIALVRQAQRLIRAQLGEQQYLFDSGTRDEIYVLLPGQSAQDGLRLAERISSAVKAYPFLLDLGTQETIHLTISIGMVCAPRHGKHAVDLVWAARQALYQAKKGRDTIFPLEDIQLVEYSLLLAPDQIAFLKLLAQHLGRSEESILHEALTRLFERHEGKWVWGVDRWESYPTMSATLLSGARAVAEGVRK